MDPRDYSLYSIAQGTMVITEEKYEPHPENPYVKMLGYFDKGTTPIYHRYVNIIPDPTPIEFKLVDLV